VFKHFSEVKAVFLKRCSTKFGSKCVSTPPTCDVANSSWSKLHDLYIYHAPLLHNTFLVRLIFCMSMGVRLIYHLRRDIDWVASDQNATSAPKREAVTVQWTKLHTEELHDLYCSPDITRMIKSRRTRWARYVETHILQNFDYLRISQWNVTAEREQMVWWWWSREMRYRGNSPATL
jgi:hypothetical protein